MATDRQVAYYKSLCEQLGQEPDDAFENLTIVSRWTAAQRLVEAFSTKEASEAITELNEMLEDR